MDANEISEDAENIVALAYYDISNINEMHMTRKYESK